MQHLHIFCPVIHIALDIITGSGVGWERVFMDISIELNCVAIFLSEAYCLAQARRWDSISPSWTNTAKAIITRAWANWGKQGTQ
eukprot:9967812-Heterocapsa_arctica.AAC.1